MSDLWNNLTALNESNLYPFHMPGHKRNTRIEGFNDSISNLFSRDITEIDNFDNLHDAKGIIKSSQEKANILYRSEESFFLVNGSSCGVLASVSAVLSGEESGRILVCRNAHKSLYNAAYLMHAEMDYLYPEMVNEYDICGKINPEDVKRKIKESLNCNLNKNSNREYRAVFITSPTYEGILSDIGEIARICHKYSIPLIVDEAHGAHFSINEKLPKGAIHFGADLVIHSLHKTLPALTQTALLHVQGDLVDRNKLKRYLKIYQSSSPSYLFMASIDSCIEYMNHNAERWSDNVINYHEALLAVGRNCQSLRIPGWEIVPDPCKIVISCKNTRITGQKLYDILREKYQLQPEMAGETYVLMIITGCDTQEGIRRLSEAIRKIDSELSNTIDETDNSELSNSIDKASSIEVSNSIDKAGNIETMDKVYINSDEGERNDYLYLQKDNSKVAEYPICRLPLYKAYDEITEKVELQKASGRIAGDFINLYPPGIPLVVPGEVISDNMCKTIYKYIKEGLNVQGIQDGKVLVCCSGSI
ncbi:aminotransferase class I/II-fold pyridoxal phosphate-dependent enzyme [Butyrivibrio sp. NC3005]|uniref:aminotransferase class I/II-fold pyridoxal phosphate-dependent enzyme n=1 Tax=Butyrivibrio sp. NC3005 TaxID=1280685 RepID=UPI00040EAB15|nr:PLP-dependent transferase [Butyrivibrio sp. NC3005]